MLTLDQKTRLGTDGRFVHLVKGAVVQRATRVTHEKPDEISFGAVQDAALAGLPDVNLAQQLAAHEMRKALAQEILASHASMADGAKRAAMALASDMAEDIAKEDAESGASCAALMIELLETKPQKPTVEQVPTGEVDEEGNPITEPVSHEPEEWERLGFLEPTKQVKLDYFITAVVEAGWSATAGFNVHYEIPKAIAAAQAPNP